LGQLDDPCCGLGPVYTNPRLASLWNLQSGTIGGKDAQDVTLEFSGPVEIEPFVGTPDPDVARENAPLSVMYEAWQGTLDEYDQLINLTAHPVEVSGYLDFTVDPTDDSHHLIKPKVGRALPAGRYTVSTWDNAYPEGSTPAMMPRLEAEGASTPVTPMTGDTSFSFMVYADCDPADGVADDTADPRQLVCGWGWPAEFCDSVDFNGDELAPDTQDVNDFISVFNGGPCPTGTCGDIDFNNDDLFPETTDIDAILRVFAGGPCLMP
jgi:hypothetical protein